MANPEQVELLRQGSDQWNTWRQENPEVRPDLSEADLSEANLHRANLYEADLSRADLSRADLSETNLHRADLHAANLSRANLSGADLRGNLSEADLSGANLYTADLYEADLSKANLTEANLTGAILSGTILSGADLTEASLSVTCIAKIDLRTTRGLATILHEGPSDIELFSVQLPQDGSALHFLRGVGVPDEWIDDYRAHMMHPIQYHSCFLSYCSKDEMLAKRLHADLQAQGVRCWFAPEDLKIGDRIHQRINEAIHLQDKLLLLLSQHSIASEWVRDEVEAALEKERRQQRDVLFPIRLDETVLQTAESWAATLRRSRHIGDFSQWESAQAYQTAFTRLLRDLKQE